MCITPQILKTRLDLNTQRLDLSGNGKKLVEHKLDVEKVDYDKFVDLNP